MDGSALAVIVIPIVTVISLAVWLITVLYAASHPDWARAPGRRRHGRTASADERADDARAVTPGGPECTRRSAEQRDGGTAEEVAPALLPGAQAGRDERQVRLARASGVLSWLPFALDYLAEIHILAGELSQAAALLMERERIDPGSREATLPYVPLVLAAWRGDAPTVAELTEVMAQGEWDRGEGATLTFADYAAAVLRNGLGNYEPAAVAAYRASAAGEIVISPRRVLTVLKTLRA
jgi:hypothetical protein